MPIRSRLLAAVNSVPPGATQDIYVVPGGRTAILRHWSVVNRTGETRRVLVSVRTGGQVVNLAVSPTLANDGVFTQPVAELVLNPGDAFGLFHSGTTTHGGMHVVLAGALLYGAPE